MLKPTYITVEGWGTVMKRGNFKLPISTVIFNLCAAHDCPSLLLGYCQAFSPDGKLLCYAMRDEIQYAKGGVVEYRRRQGRFWDTHTPQQILDIILEYNKRTHIPVTTFRYNEAGDFRSQEDVDKMQEFARLCKKHHIIVYGYTARQDLNFSNTPDLIIMGSSFKKAGVSGEFRLIPTRKDRPEGFGLCPMDCKKCTRCLRGLDTAILPHGPGTEEQKKHKALARASRKELQAAGVSSNI